MAWTTFHHRSSYECGECKEGSVHLTLTLTTIFRRCQQTVQLPLVPKPIQLKQTTSPKMAKKCFKGNYIRTMYFVLSIVCCVVYCLLCITVLCCDNNQMQKCFKGNYITTMYFVLRIVCCVSQYCVVPTIICKFFQQNLIFFITT